MEDGRTSAAEQTEGSGFGGSSGGQEPHRLYGGDRGDFSLSVGTEDPTLHGGVRRRSGELVWRHSVVLSGSVYGWSAKETHEVYSRGPYSAHHSQTVSVTNKCRVRIGKDLVVVVKKYRLIETRRNQYSTFQSEIKHI